MSNNSILTVRRRVPTSDLDVLRRGAIERPYHPHLSSRRLREAVSVELGWLSMLEQLQPRHQLNQDHIAQLQEAFRAGAPVEPIDVFIIGEELVVADGWHRYLAAQRVGETKIRANIYAGSLDDAQAHALWRNRGNALGLSQEEKRDALLKLLRSPDYYRLSTRKLGDLIGVSARTVSTYKREVPRPKGVAEGVVLVERGGQVYEMNTTGIAEATSERAAVEVEEPAPADLGPDEIEGIPNRPLPREPERSSSKASAPAPPRPPAPLPLFDTPGAPDDEPTLPTTPWTPRGFFASGWPEVSQWRPDGGEDVWSRSWSGVTGKLPEGSVILTPLPLGAQLATATATAQTAEVYPHAVTWVEEEQEHWVVWAHVQTPSTPHTVPTIDHLAQSALSDRSGRSV